MDRQFIYVSTGTRIVPENGSIYTFEFYVLNRPGQYIYSYDYEPEEKWLTRAEEFEPKEPITGEYIFTADKLPQTSEGYIVVKPSSMKVSGDDSAAEKSHGNDSTAEKSHGDDPTGENIRVIPSKYETCEEAERASVRAKVSAFMMREDVRSEVRHTAETIAGILRSTHSQKTQVPNDPSANSGSAGKLVFTLIADTHYVLNGNWEYTEATIRAVNDRLYRLAFRKPNAVIHLGDLTDGILSKETCRKYSSRVLTAIRSMNLPFYFVAGNHDANYFRSNADIMSEEEQCRMYMPERSRLFYRSDLADHNLTILTLSAYENSEKNRYGYTNEQLDWIRRELVSLPADRRVLILSHDAPLAKLDYWASEIRNGDMLCDILDSWNRARGGRIIGLLHGHTHADMIYTKRTFPIISVGCSKIEYFEDRKPDGAICHARFEGEVTQELWDTLIIDPETGDMDFVRFGAGFDRHIAGNCAPADEQGADPDKHRDFIKAPLVWAHRGASGYLPENTLEAFYLADKMGADGIELDVQFTRDRKIVVIHDEWIDRTSDGIGKVAEMTLEELREYNFNRMTLDDRHMDIPTLDEVLTLIKPTRMVINIELKTGLNFYPGLEEAVIALVKRFDMQDRVIYSSFNHESLVRVAKISPDAALGTLYMSGIADPVSYTAGMGMQAIHPSVDCMRYPGLIERCKKRGIRTHVWTVNTEAQMERMRQLGVDAIITNYPDVALKLYGRPYRTVDEIIPKEEPAVQEAPAEQPLSEIPAAKETKDNISEPAKSAERRRHALPLRIAGTAYKYARRPFVALDRAIQKAARKP